MKLAKTVSYTLFFFFIFSCFGVFPQSVHATAYGLLVGVSEYPSLPEQRWLHGPRNDVQMLSTILKKRGFQKENITILADGIKGAKLPTRQAILDALKKLNSTVKKDDFVYFHLAGHGSQQPQLPTATNKETDGLDEIFLPYDTGKWESEISRVKNSISDDEIGAAITGLREKGAFVWAVFDSCHSGTMLRGAPTGNMKYRKVSPKELGIPIAALTPPVPSKRKQDEKKTEPSSLGGYVAFYAAQPHELTPEMYLPSGRKDAKPYGLFSYAIAKLLSSNQPMSYRQAAQRILQSYIADNVRMPTPLFEGSHLDAPLFGSENSSPVRQWPIERKWMIQAGILNQIEDGSIFAILNSPADKDENALGYAVIKNTTLTKGQLEPVEHGGLPKLNIKDVSRDAYARLITPKVNFQITVALPNADKEDSQQSAVSKTIQKIATQTPPAGIEIKWVKAGQEADIRLGFSPQNQPDCPQDRLWLLPPSGELTCTGRREALSIVLNKKQNELQDALYTTIRKIGKVINLLRLAEAVSANETASKLELAFYLKRNGDGEERKIGPEQYLELQDGDHIRVEATNKGNIPMDLTLLFVDSQYGIDAMYPSSVGEVNRLQPNASIPDVIDATINAETIGTESLIAIAVAAKPQSPNADFSFLAQARLPKTRSRDAACTDQQCSIEGWFQQAGFGTASTRGMTNNRRSRMKTSMTMFSWNVGN